MIIVVLRPFTCPVINFITVMNVNRDTCVDYWIIRNPNVCCLKSSIKDINLNVKNFFYLFTMSFRYVASITPFLIFKFFTAYIPSAIQLLKKSVLFLNLRNLFPHIGWLSITFQKILIFYNLRSIVTCNDFLIKLRYCS